MRRNLESRWVAINVRQVSETLGERGGNQSHPVHRVWSQLEAKAARSNRNSQTLPPVWIWDWRWFVQPGNGQSTKPVKRPTRTRFERWSAEALLETMKSIPKVNRDHGSGLTPDTTRQSNHHHQEQMSKWPQLIAVDAIVHRTTKCNPLLHWHHRRWRFVETFPRNSNWKNFDDTKFHGKRLIATNPTVVEIWASWKGAWWAFPIK